MLGSSSPDDTSSSEGISRKLSLIILSNSAGSTAGLAKHSKIIQYTNNPISSQALYNITFCLWFRGVPFSQS